MNAADAMRKLGTETCSRCSAVETATERAFGLLWCKDCLKIVYDSPTELLSIASRTIRYQTDPGQDSADSSHMRSEDDFWTPKP